MSDAEDDLPQYGDSCCRCRKVIETKRDLRMSRHRNKGWIRTPLDTWWCSKNCRAGAEAFLKKIEKIRKLAEAIDAEKLGDCFCCGKTCLDGACLQWQHGDDERVLLCSPMCMDRFARDFPDKGDQMFEHFSPEKSRARMEENGTLQEAKDNMNAVMAAMTDEQRAEVAAEVQKMTE